MTTRPLWQRPLIWILLFFIILAATSRYLLTSASIGDAMRVRITDLPPDVQEKVNVIVMGHDGIHGTKHIAGTSYYRFAGPTWIEALLVLIPEKEIARIEQVEITFGTEGPVKFTAAEVRGWKKEPAERLPFLKEISKPGDVVLFVPNVFGRASALHRAEPCPWNWPGDFVYVRSVVQYALLPSLLLGFAILFGVRIGSDTVRHWIVAEPDAPARDSTTPLAGAAGSWSGSWNWIGLLFLVGILTMLEFRDPYYFTQDDNLIESLPMILVGCRGIWLGEFPDYNPYLFMGSPLASLGMYALTYPPLPISYAFARHILGQEYATIEVFAIFHILAGFLVIRVLSRKLGMGPLPANLVALSCVLSGAALIMGRCWFNFMPVFLWMPVMLLGLVHLWRGPVGWKWVIGMGLASGISFHVGFSQAAIYINGFFCLAVLYLVVTRAITWRQALPVIPAMLIGAGIALPLIYQQWLFAQDITRHAIVDKGVAVGLPGMLLPYPFVEVPLPTQMGSENLQCLGEFYFFGGVFAFLFFMQVVGLFFFRPARSRWSGQIWTFLAIIALWLALGDAGGLWTIAKHLPVIGFINRHPLRLMPFVVIFMTLSGGLVLNRMLPRRGMSNANPAGKSTPVLIAIATLLLLTIHASQCRTAFYSYQFKPYPPLPEKMQDALGQQKVPERVSSWSALRSTDPNFPWLLPLDLPAVYRLPSVDGYNPLLGGMMTIEIGGKPQVLKMIGKLRDNPLAAMRAYGIRWHLWHEPNRVPRLSPASSTSWNMEIFNKSLHFDPIKMDEFVQKCEVAAQFDGIVLRKLPDVDSLAFSLDNPRQALELFYGSGGVNVDVAPLKTEQTVVVNFLYYPENTRAYVDGQQAPCEPDEWFRIKVRVPAGSKVVSIRYMPPWATGVWMGLGAIGAGLAFYWFIPRSRRL